MTEEQIETQVEETVDAVRQEGHEIPEEGQEEVATKPPPKDLDPNEEWDRVDFENDPPEKIQRRFNRLYAEEKRNQRAMERLGADNRALLERLEALEKAQTESTVASKREQIETQRRAAFEEHDYEAFAEADQMLRELDFETRATPAPTNGQRHDDGGDLTEEQQSAIVSWCTEMGPDGNFKRPWAFPQHPQYNKAIQYVIATVNDPNYADAISSGDYNSVFAAVDNMMSPPKARRSTPVLSGDHAPSAKKGPQLSEDMKRVARAMFPGEKDPYARYAAAMERYGR